MSRLPQPGCNFALICTICGNHKTFSDLSHTLTHLNSRGHLQQKHRLELQAPSDPSVQTILDNYNIWYTTNNIASLLSERMNIPKGGAKKSSKPKAKHVIKAEDVEDTETPVPESAVKRTQPLRAASRYAPPNDEQDSDPLDSTWSHEDEYQNSRPSHTISGFVPVLIPIDPMLSSMIHTSGGKTKGCGTLELKGDVLEGMAVFDSATPRTRRGRNQRKGPEVLEQMKKNSAEVEPAEISYHPNGEFRATRDIFGPPSSDPSSPIMVPSPKKRKSSRSTTKPGPVLQHKSAKLPVRVTKPQPAKIVFVPGTGRRSPTRRSMSMHTHGTNYLNPNIVARFHSSGPTPNPFMQAGNSNSNSLFALRDSHSGEGHDYKPAPVQFAIPKPANTYPEFGLSYGEHGVYPGNGFAFQRHEEVRGGNMASGSANPLSSAYPRYERQSESPLSEEPRFDYQNHGLPSSFTHLNEPNALRGSPTPVPQTTMLTDSHKPHRPSHPSQQLRTTSPPPQWPKPGVFRTSGTNRAEQFPYRAHEGFRPVAVMNGETYGIRKDHGRQDVLSRQFASIRNPNNDVTLSRRQNNSSTKPNQANNGRLRDEAFPGRDRDGQVKSTSRTSLNSTSSALRSHSPDHSSSRRSVQSTPHSRYGAEMESEYYDEQYRGYDGERQ